MIPQTSIIDKPMADALARMGKPVFVRRVAEQLAISHILTDEMLANARSEGEAQRCIAELAEVLVERLAHETGTRIALFARVMMPVYAMQEQTVTWPANWRQAFRARWLPRWWLRRHPVKYRSETLMASINMSEIVKACMGEPAEGKDHDALQIIPTAPEVEFDRL